MKKHNNLFKNAMLLSTMLTPVLCSLAMEQQNNSDVSQIALIRSNYRQKWLHAQPQPAEPVQDLSYQPPLSTTSVQLPSEEHIVSLFLHRFADYEQTFGDLPAEIKQLLAQKILQTIPTLSSIIRIETPRIFHSESMGPYPTYNENRKISDYGHMICGCFNDAGNKLAYATKNGLHILSVTRDTEGHTHLTNRVSIWHGMNKADILDVRFLNGGSVVAVIDSFERGRAFSCDGKQIFDVKNSKALSQEAAERTRLKKQAIACMNLDCTKETCTGEKKIHGLCEQLASNQEKRYVVDFEYCEESDLIHIVVEHCKSEGGMHFPCELLTYYLTSMKKITSEKRQYRNTLSNHLIVHHANNTLFFYGHWDAGTKEFLTDFSPRVHYDNFMRNIDLDQALCLAILFQLKKQNKQFNRLEYPHLAKQLSNLPVCIQEKFKDVVTEPTKNSCVIL